MFYNITFLLIEVLILNLQLAHPVVSSTRKAGPVRLYGQIRHVHLQYKYSKLNWTVVLYIVRERVEKNLFLISLFGRTAINVFKRLVWRALGYQGFRTLPTEVNKWSKNEDFWSVIQNDTIGTSYRNNVWFSIDWGIKNVT